ncbi:DUF6802 family protein [Gordonia sp. NPDC003424]
MTRTWGEQVDMSFLGGEALDGHSGDDSFGPDDRISIDAAYITPDDASGDTSPADHLWMHTDGRVWDLGPADVDTDNDGVRDSLTRSGPDGLTVYTDSDHDGQVDKITEIDAHGAFSSRSLDPLSGTWVPTDSGRLG